MTTSTSRVALGFMLLGIAATIASAVAKPALRLVYNASDSAPLGWYLVDRTADFRVGDYIIARLPRQAAVLAASREYLPRSVPVLKQIAAVSGQRVCVREGEVRIDARVVARLLQADGNGRPLAPWAQCRLLLEGELFLLNPTVPGSFDSRYFGPIDVSYASGRATSLAAVLP